MTTTPADITLVLSRLTVAANAHDQDVIADSAVDAGLMWRCPCGGTNAYGDTACGVCAAARLWTTDKTPPRYEYGKLLEDLRSALVDWFNDRSQVRRPAAVSFRVTTGYDDCPAWATWGASVHFPNSPDAIDYPHDFERTLVADALVEISEFDRPQTGDTLRVVVPALGSVPAHGDAAQGLHPAQHPLVGEYAYAVCDYAREAAQVLGDDWGSESGYIGAYGLIWGPGVPTLRLHVDHDDDLVLQLNDDADSTPHIVPLPDGAP
ncbi:hypothetical protein AB0B05_34985, partial [Streptomyces chrestomyceticus]